MAVAARSASTVYGLLHRRSFFFVPHEPLTNLAGFAGQVVGAIGEDGVVTRWREISRLSAIAGGLAGVRLGGAIEQFYEAVL